jgi:hypothetical protein
MSVVIATNEVPGLQILSWEQTGNWDSQEGTMLLSACSCRHKNKEISKQKELEDAPPRKKARKSLLVQFLS